MVASQLNNRVNYPEWKRVEEEDKGQEMEMFEVELLPELPMYVTVGQARNRFLSHRILYFPLYLIQPDDTAIQVGVIEIESDNAVDSSRYSPEMLLSEYTPLLYSFATDTYLRKHRKTPDPPARPPRPPSPPPTQRDRESGRGGWRESAGDVVGGGGRRGGGDGGEENEREKGAAEAESQRYIPQIRRELFELVPNVKQMPKLKEESEKEATQNRKMYHEREGDTWIQKFLRNRGYAIVHDGGNEKGECLFTVIRDAFLQIGQQTTDARLRAYFADKVDDAWFQAYRQRYLVFEKEVVEKRAMSTKLKHVYDSIKARIQNTFDRAQQALLREEALRLKSEYEDMKTTHSFAKENLKTVQFMKDVDTLDAFRKHVRTSDFCGDAWTLHWMQYHLNLQFIVFSAEKYREGNMDAVLECVPATLRNKYGQTLFPEKENEDVVPEFYLLLVREGNSGDRYLRVEYRKRALLGFSELPFDLKKMLADKCNETEGGRLEKVGALLPYRNRSAHEGMRGGGGIHQLVVWNAEEETPVNLLVEKQMDEMDDAKLLDFYDNTVQFSLSPNASATALPGQGSEERCDLEKCMQYAELAKHKDWRRKLDDSFMQFPLFQLDGHGWNSVDHFMNALPYKSMYPEYYLQYTHESGSDMSKNVERAVAGASKSGKWKGTRVRPVEVTASRETMSEVDRARLHDALVAKYAQNKELAKVLDATLNAKLVRHRRGLPPLVLNQLMKVRDEMRRDNAFVGILERSARP